MNSIKEYDNIIMFTNGSIGDFLMASLCADSARKRLGNNANIIILAPRNVSILRDLFSAYAYIQAIEINRRNFLRALVSLLMRMVWQRNLVVNQGVFKRIPFLARSLARLLTLRRGSNYLHFSQREESNKQKEGEVVIFDYHLSVYKNLARLFNTQGIAISSTVPPYHFVRDPSALERYGLIHSSYVVIHPCASSFSRSLPIARWAGIFEYITVNFPDIKVVITGSKQDDQFIQRILELSVSTTSLIDLAGRLSMTELANIVDGARGYIGVDTGVTHLAGVLQKRSVIIGNLSNPCWLPFYNKDATILTERKSCTCNGQKGGNCFYLIEGEKYYKCIIDISKKTIYESITKMFP